MYISREWKPRSRRYVTFQSFDHGFETDTNAACAQSRDALAAKSDEIELLKKTIAGKDDYVKDLQAEVDAAVSFHTQDQDEIERLKQVVTELQATKDQLMRDHEQLSVQRNRLCIPSVEHASARSSGTTLIQEVSPPLTKPVIEPPIIEALPPMPDSSDDMRANSIQETPKRHLRSESTPNRWHLMSNDIPPPELRGFRRRSLGLKDLMKKMVGKETKVEDVTEPNQAKEEEETADLPSSRDALSAKDKNASIRPATAAPKVSDQDPFYTPQALPAPQSIRSANVRRHTPRYYAAQDASKDKRPQTAAADVKASKDDTSVSTKRRSWGAS